MKQIIIALMMLTLFACSKIEQGDVYELRITGGRGHYWMGLNETAGQGGILYHKTVIKFRALQGDTVNYQVVSTTSGEIRMFKGDKYASIGREIYPNDYELYYFIVL